MNLVGPLRLPRLRIPPELARNARFVARMVKERSAVARAAKRMPRPMPWDWARPRIMPLLSGPALDDPEAPIMRSTAGPGCAIEFGVNIGGPYLVVDAVVAERWECSSDQLRSVALENLRNRVARLTPANLGTGVFSGRQVRTLRGPRFSASLVLLEEELKRLFGSHDQILAVPSQSFLISFPFDTPPRTMADAVVDLELACPAPLLYEPFLLSDGHLIWQPGDASDEDWR